MEENYKLNDKAQGLIRGRSAAAQSTVAASSTSAVQWLFDLPPSNKPPEVGLEYLHAETGTQHTMPISSAVHSNKEDIKHSSYGVVPNINSRHLTELQRVLAIQSLLCELYHPNVRAAMRNGLFEFPHTEDHLLITDRIISKYVRPRFSEAAKKIMEPKKNGRVLLSSCTNLNWRTLTVVNVM